ncbi:MAG: hypothetical protein GXX79_00560 [Actinomycetales bacterium]|nr:hypothetical protein [Actinomycetales bacterium]
MRSGYAGDGTASHRADSIEVVRARTDTAPGTGPAPVTRDGTGRPAQVWVEAPLQMLGVIEACHLGVLGPGTTIVPRARAPLLLETAAALAVMGLPDGVTMLAPRPNVPRASRDDPVGVGDPFSGVVQRAWALSRPRDVVILDDGLATLHLLEVLASPRSSLTRARATRRLLRRLLGAYTAAQLRSLARTGNLTVFTALPVPDALVARVEGEGARILRHSFDWLRSRTTTAAPEERRVVLGSSLVRNGLVHAEPYLAWLSSLADEGPVAYFPHRRENEAFLRWLRGDDRFRVYEPGVPAEISLRGLGSGYRILSLPSTAIVSLRLILGARGVPVEAVRVPEEWWTDRASSQLRERLNSVHELPRI